MENENEQVVGAYRLWKADLISTEAFYSALIKLKDTKYFDKGGFQGNPNEITQGQKNYILKLQAEGKIPKSQSLNISKSEAQILIKEAVEKKDEVEQAVRATQGLAEALADTQGRFKELYEGGDNY